MCPVFPWFSSSGLAEPSFFFTSWSVHKQLFKNPRPIAHINPWFLFLLKVSYVFTCCWNHNNSKHRPSSEPLLSLPRFLPYLPIWNTLWQDFNSFDDYVQHIISIWIYFQEHIHIYIYIYIYLMHCIYKSGLRYSSSIPTSLTKCHCHLQTDWTDRVTLPGEGRESVSSSVQQSLWKRQSNLLDAAAPSSTSFAAWSVASKTEKKKGFCSYSSSFPGMHSCIYL